jgi:phosphate acyltransferase
VAVDCNGADRGPGEVAAGAALAASRGARVLLFGPADQLRQAVAEAPVGTIEVVDTPVSIAKSADPASAARKRPEASIVQASRAVGENRAQALVCAGGTGAALAAGLFNIKRARGIHRPALALPIPGPPPARPVTLLDVGANAQARSEHLEQFAFMGAAFASTVLGIERPRVGLLSNGEEAERGSSLVVETHARLAALSATLAPVSVASEGDAISGGTDAMSARDSRRSGGGQVSAEAEALTESRVAFEFVGNVEGGDVVAGVADVIVTDGFTGNVALKLMEGVSQTVLRAVRDAALSSTRGKLGGVLLRPALAAFRDEIDPEGQGGAYLLGLRRLGVVPHGGFSRKGFAQAILRAHAGAQADLVGRTHAALARAGALRAAPLSRAGAAPRLEGEHAGSGPMSVSSASLPSDDA